MSSLSLYDQRTPPSSPISVSPTESPRAQRRTVRDSGDEESQMYHLPPITSHPNHVNTQSHQSHAYPLSSQPAKTAKRMSNGYEKGSVNDIWSSSDQYSQLTMSRGGLSSSAPAFTQFTASSYPPRSHATFIPHSFDKSNSHSQAPQPVHPNHPNQHIPRTAGAPSTSSAAIVITQPIATICEVPGFKRRGRPSTRIDNQCVECGTHRTPEWRRGEGGVHLCNACGLQYSKRVRRERAEKKRNAITAVLNPHDTDV